MSEATTPGTSSTRQTVTGTPDMPWVFREVPNDLADHVIVGKMDSSDGVTSILVGFGYDHYSISQQGPTIERRLTSLTRMHENRAIALMEGLIENLGPAALEKLGYVRK
ncbi:hypothetical protein LQ772_06655 [Frateuria edaphi]|uniref:hypothetical protein n=1 Tax=Frateuria edaphi TaxID=2898793 RepID=UPI001E48014C|nr:hypothetical protein [Frateuria edaphi]UGB46966.1 hypothetical protein LQ772_06655 [Frateuria edaphi]